MAPKTSYDKGSPAKNKGKKKSAKVKLRKKDNIWVRIIKKIAGDKVSEAMERHEPDHPTEYYNEVERKWKKREKPVWLPDEDWKLLKSIRENAHWLDYGCSCCCGSVIIGRSAVISLAPAIGPIVCIALGTTMVNCKAQKFDIPWTTTAMMYVRIGVSEGIGLVPVAGEVFVAWFKASTRNLYALEKALEKRHDKPNRRRNVRDY